MILHLTTLKGQIYNPVYVQSQNISYIDAIPENSTRKGCFIYFNGGGSLWVCETVLEVLQQFPPEAP